MTDTRHLRQPPMPQPPPVTAAPTGDTLLRSTKVMAAGTLVSRATGMISKLLLAWAVGTRVGDPYNIANTLPNIVYDMLLGGILTSVVVPLIVRAADHDEDNGEAYAQRLLTLVTVVLGLAVVVTVGLAPLISHIYLNGSDPAKLHLTTTFARFFLPQIVFYGIGATMGAILNARGHFAAPMWAPVLNNLVLIATLVAFFFLPGPHGLLSPQSITTAQIWTLGVGTTFGIIVQTVALVPALRRVGFRWRPRFDFRHAGLAAAGRLAGWVLLYVIVNQLGLAVITRLATSAFSSAHGGYSLYTYAYLLFQLPHAIVAVSVITALLPRMSRDASAGRHRALVRELSRGTRLAAVVLVPASFGLIALNQPITHLLFAHVQLSASEAGVIGWTLAGFSVGLLPFSVFQLQLRAFYAMHDTRFPALANIALTAINLAIDAVLFVVLPARWVVPGLALGYAASYVVGLGVFGRELTTRLGGLDRRRVVRTCVRLMIAGVLAGAIAYALAAGVARLLGTTTVGSLVQLAVATPIAAAVFLWAAASMRIREVRELLGSFTRRRAER